MISLKTKSKIPFIVYVSPTGMIRSFGVKNSLMWHSNVSIRAVGFGVVYRRDAVCGCKKTYFTLKLTNAQNTLKTVCYIPPLTIDRKFISSGVGHVSIC